MTEIERKFYSFLGLHSFLIGLFPFYIPVYLFAGGFSLSWVSLFISITGVGYCLMLFVWERVQKYIPLSRLIIFSFFSEVALLCLFFQEKNIAFLVSAGFANGVFNCNFWIIQRILFLKTVTPADTGRKFGNFQLFVLVVLKIAIFIGGVVLESFGFTLLFLFSVFTAIAASVYFVRNSMVFDTDKTIQMSRPLSLRSMAFFSDRYRSRGVFIIDGLFLYLESYFWVISLFLIVQESFARLGILVILLTLVFGLLFITIKNTIDRLPGDLVYKGGVILYCGSWLMRWGTSENMSTVKLLLLLAVITFCTSIFRLTFNKRFFDIAKNTTAHEYIFLKSYLSQAFLLLFLLVPLISGMSGGNTTEQLANIYLGAALLSVVYFIYRYE